MQKFAAVKLHNVVFPENSWPKYFLKSLLITLAAALLILTLANPQVGTKYEDVKQAGIDVYILLDVSASMRAEDIKPNRLEKARHSIEGLISKLKGDRIGLIVFSGDAYVQFPLTTDYAAANLFLSAVDFNSVPQPGTAISAAVRLATKSFRSGDAVRKVIIAVTDGEDHEGDLMSNVKDAVDKGISVYAIGMGTPEGVPIPMSDAQGHKTGFKTDQQGSTVLTKLDENSLIDMSSKGNGRYYRGTSSENELETIYNDLSGIQKTEFGTTRIISFEDRYYFCLIPALILLMIELLVSEKRSRLWGRLNNKIINS